MSTFITSLSLILIGFAMFYPFFFTKIYALVKENVEARSFLQLNYILHLLSGTIAVLLFWTYSVNYPLQLSGIVYLVVIFVVVLYYWNSPIPKWNLFSASIVFGFIVFYRTINEIVEITPLWPGIFTGILSAGAVSVVMLLLVASLYRSIRKNALSDFINSLFKYLFLFIGIRIAWDLVVLFNISVETRNGELMSALKFFLQVDPIKLVLLILFGLVIPLLFYFLFKKRLSAINSKYRFWIFCFLLISTLFGEFLFKYFLLQYGIVL